MLLSEKMKQYPFSSSERTIIDFILEKQEDIKDYTTKSIAKETYTSPSVLVRIAKKLGYQGYNEFKEDYLKEVYYLHSHFEEIDANYPFTEKDNIMTIAGKIASVYEESARDTVSLLDHDDLMKAVQMILKSKTVRVFAISNLNFVAQEFVFKMNRIHQKAEISVVQDMMFHDAAMMEKDECAICISYSGETPHILQVSETLKEHQIPLIAITSFGENHLSSMSDVTLHISTREKSYSKIGAFSSLTSISLILDTLYACVFAQHYQRNLDYKLNKSREIETTRIIDNDIIEESGK